MTKTNLAALKIIDNVKQRERWQVQLEVAEIKLLSFSLGVTWMEEILNGRDQIHGQDWIFWRKSQKGQVDMVWVSGKLGR